MISRKRLVRLHDAVAGMVLSQAVVDGNGNTLLPEAAVLTESMLKSLERRGVETLHVVDNEISKADKEAERERVQQRLARLFRRSEGGRACRALLQRVNEYRLGEAG